MTVVPAEARPHLPGAADGGHKASPRAAGYSEGAATAVTAARAARSVAASAASAAGGTAARAAADGGADGKPLVLTGGGGGGGRTEDETGGGVPAGLGAAGSVHCALHRLVLQMVKPLETFHRLVTAGFTKLLVV